MLAHQLAEAHKLAMMFAAKAQKIIKEEDGPRDWKEGLYATEASRVANVSTKMMDAFQRGPLALHKLRTGGTQTVTVQQVWKGSVIHVNVSAGG